MTPRDVLERLVATPSETGNEAAAVALMQAIARGDGLTVREDAAGNFIAETGKGSRLFLLVGHIDTVPGHIPVRVEDGQLWGRGSVDAKGCLVAFYALARAHKDDPDFRFVVVGCVDEEGSSRGAHAIDRTLAPEFILVGEPSGFDGLTLGYKGILRGEVVLERHVQHGGHPGGGAADALVDFWSAVRQRFAFEDGFKTVHGRLGAIKHESDGLVERLTAGFQVRLPPGRPPGPAQRELLEVAQQYGALITVTDAIPPALAPRNSSLATAFVAELRSRGLQPRLKHKTGTADLNLLAAWFPDVPIAAYGPGDSRLDHTAEERLGLDDFDRALEILDGVIDRLR